MNKIINWCRGVNNWLNYVRSYSENKDNEEILDRRIIEQRKKINNLKKEIKSLEFINQQQAGLLELRDKRVQELSKKYSEAKKELKRAYCFYEETNKQNEELQEKLADKEHSRRKSAGAIGGYKAKISYLEEKLEKANYTINFYKTRQKSPNIEELKAYEYSRKEVEKRIKDGR